MSPFRACSSPEGARNRLYSVEVYSFEWDGIVGDELYSVKMYRFKMYSLVNYWIRGVQEASNTESRCRISSCTCLQDTIERINPVQKHVLLSRSVQFRIGKGRGVQSTSATMSRCTNSSFTLSLGSRNVLSWDEVYSFEVNCIREYP